MRLLLESSRTSRSRRCWRRTWATTPTRAAVCGQVAGAAHVDCRIILLILINRWRH